MPYLLHIFIYEWTKDNEPFYRRQCKRLTNDDKTYSKAVEAMKAAQLCVDTWKETQINNSYYRKRSDMKPMLKKCVFFSIQILLKNHNAPFPI